MQRCVNLISRTKQPTTRPRSEVATQLLEFAKKNAQECLFMKFQKMKVGESFSCMKIVDTTLCLYVVPRGGEICHLY